jgi:hypothetical protein
MLSTDRMKNHKRRVLEKKSNEVIIIGQPRGCPSKVKQLLYNDFKVLGCVNPE